MIPKPKSFNIKSCPICSCQLNVNYVDGHTVLYQCPTLVSTKVPPSVSDETLAELFAVPHYVIQIIDSSKIEQRSIIPPYTLITNVKEGRTFIYETEHKGGTGYIMNVPTILPTNEPEKLAQRIKNLIIFS